MFTTASYNRGRTRPCLCGSGLQAWWEHDARGMPLARVCVKCKDEKLAKMAKLQPEKDKCSE